MSFGVRCVLIGVDGVWSFVCCLVMFVWCVSFVVGCLSVVVVCVLCVECRLLLVV